MNEINIQQLKELAIYLEGLKAGKGDLYPLGTAHLENLWEVINHLNREKSK
jgi:hypothetical protein